MLEAIILAGGHSRRSGRQHKACRRQPGERRSWLDRQIDRLRAAGIGRVVVVLGYRPRRVLACLHRRAALTRNPRAGLGPFSSLQAGLRTLAGDVLVLPLDTPLPPAGDIRRLYRRLHDAAAISPTDAAGRGGHPVILTRRLARSLSRLGPGARLDRQLRALPPGHHVRLRIGGSAVSRDLNTPRDWRDYMRRR